MNGVLGTIQLLLDTKLHTEQLDYVLTMKHSADGLLSVINDVLLFSKLEAKQLQFHSSSFRYFIISIISMLTQTRIDRAFEGVGGLLGALVNEKQQQLYFLIENKHVPAIVVSDLGRLQQVLWIHFSN